MAFENVIICNYVVFHAKTKQPRCNIIIQGIKQKGHEVDYHLHLRPRLRKCGVIPAFPHTPLRLVLNY
jgi:hypothetical protein